MSFLDEAIMNLRASQEQQNEEAAAKILERYNKAIKAAQARENRLIKQGIPVAHKTHKLSKAEAEEYSKTYAGRSTLETLIKKAGYKTRKAGGSAKYEEHPDYDIDGSAEPVDAIDVTISNFMEQWHMSDANQTNLEMVSDILDTIAEEYFDNNTVKFAQFLSELANAGIQLTQEETYSLPSVVDYIYRVEEFASSNGYKNVAFTLKSAADSISDTMEDSDFIDEDFEFADIDDI